MSTSPSRHSRRHGTGHSRLLPGISTPVRVGALLVMCIAAAVFTWQCLGRLGGIRDAVRADGSGLQVATVVFVLSVVLVLVVEVACLGRRLSRPEHDVRLALQRIRAGDVGFRVPLRRGEPLSRLVHECNGLLEWLNRNPPRGVRVDADVFELPGDHGDEVAS